MAKLTLKDTEMKKQGYEIEKVFSGTNSHDLTSIVYKKKDLEITIGKCENTKGFVFTNGSVQEHDIDLDELEYLEEIYIK